MKSVVFFWDLSCNRVVGLLLDSTIWPRYGEGTVKNRFPKCVILGTFGVILGDLTHYIQGINSIDTNCENSAQTKTLLSKGNTSDCYWRQWTPQIWRQRFLFSEKNSGADPWTDTILQCQQLFRLVFPVFVMLHFHLHNGLLDKRLKSFGYARSGFEIGSVP